MRTADGYDEAFATCYRKEEGDLEIKLFCIDPSGKMEEALKRSGQELTVFRFSLDDEGRLISGSVHDLPQPLRSKAS